MRHNRRKPTSVHYRLRYVYYLGISMSLLIGGSLLNRYQHPTFINPVIAETTQIPPTPTPTPDVTARLTAATETPDTTTTTISPEHAYILTKHHPDILWRMYGLESSFGRNDGCKASGEFNGFGFAQNTTTWNCYGSFTEVVDKVDAWLDTELAHHTLAQSLCLYNQGIIENDCRYARNFMNL